MVLAGKRICLKSITPEITGPFFRAFCQMDEECRIMAGVRDEITEEQVSNYIRKVYEQSKETHFYIEIINQKKIIGDLALTDTDLNNKHSSIRLSIYRPDQRNKGYGTEAMHLALDYGFKKLNLHRIELTVYEHNDRAIHVYRKMGFRKEGLLRDLYFYKGHYHNAILMSILKEEYKKYRQYF